MTAQPAKRHVSEKGSGHAFPKWCGQYFRVDLELNCVAIRVAAAHASCCGVNLAVAALGVLGLVLDSSFGLGWVSSFGFGFGFCLLGLVLGFVFWVWFGFRPHPVRARKD